MTEQFKTEDDSGVAGASTEAPAEASGGAPQAKTYPLPYLHHMNIGAHARRITRSPGTLPGPSLDPK